MRNLLRQEQNDNNDNDDDNDNNNDEHLAVFEKEIEKNLVLVRSAEELRAEALKYKEERVVRVAKEADLVTKRQQLLVLQVTRGDQSRGLYNVHPSNMKFILCSTTGG